MRNKKVCKFYAVILCQEIFFVSYIFNWKKSIFSSLYPRPTYFLHPKLPKLTKLWVLFQLNLVKQNTFVCILKMENFKSSLFCTNRKKSLKCIYNVTCKRSNNLKLLNEITNMKGWVSPRELSVPKQIIFHILGNSAMN